MQICKESKSWLHENGEGGRRESEGEGSFCETGVNFCYLSCGNGFADVNIHSLSTFTQLYLLHLYSLLYENMLNESFFKNSW